MRLKTVFCGLHFMYCQSHALCSDHWFLCLFFIRQYCCGTYLRKNTFYVFINSEELSFKVKLDLRNWFSTESKQSITDERKKERKKFFFKQRKLEFSPKLMSSTLLYLRLGTNVTLFSLEFE